MLKDINFTRKFPLVMISFALISAIATGIIAYTNTASSMKEAAKNNLIALLESRKSSLEQYFGNIEQQVSFHAKSPLVIRSVNDFKRSWDKLDNPKNYLQQHYIYTNPFKPGKKDSLLAAQDNSEYTEFHRQYHPIFSNMIAGSSYYDFFLLDTRGNLLYSVAKELDYATNLLSGEWRDTGIAKLYRSINDHPVDGSIQLADFDFYGPSQGDPASFVGAPIFNQQHVYQGVLILQLPIEPLNDIMQVTAGMGETGETYLVGTDMLMRSNSRFYQERSILTTLVSTPSVHSALLGKTSFGIIDDYRGITVFSAFSPVSFLGVHWAMLAEMDEAEILKPVLAMSNFLLLTGILIALVISALGYLLASDISRPIVTMTKIMNQLSENDLSANIRVSDRKDEVGKMANAMVVFKRNAIERDELQRELSHLAIHDALTGLYTRKFGIEKLRSLLEKAKSHQHKLVLMHLNVDNFKQINATYGHSIGDQVLCDIAIKLKAYVRDDDVVARLGGDEFLIILPNVEDLEDSLNIANKILHKVQPRLPMGESNPKLTMSIGLSVFPDDGTEACALLRQADRAMYSVKCQGKNRVDYWRSEMEEPSRELV